MFLARRVKKYLSGVLSVKVKKVKMSKKGKFLTIFGYCFIKIAVYNKGKK